MSEEELEEHIEEMYNVFIRWYSIPMDSRDPKTIAEFCDKMGIQMSDIAMFQKRPDFTEDLYRQAIAWGKSKVPELLHILYEKYKTSKNPTDLRMYKELLNLDKTDKDKEEKDSSRTGILRELFNSTK